jgi:hypothetical protein
MSIINFGSSISLKQVPQMQCAFCGEDTTIIGCGEPGIGKSFKSQVLEKRFPGYETAYIDCTLLDLGGFALPYTVEVDGMKVTEFAQTHGSSFTPASLCSTCWTSLARHSSL